MALQKVQLTGARETMLVTLYGRAVESRSADPILEDKLAEEIVARLDYDFARFKVSRSEAMSVAVRVKYVDRAAADALADVPGATVLHLACGLDTRTFRMDPDARLEWYEVDYPEVIDLRRQIVPDRPTHHLIGSSVTDLGWLEQVPADRPVVVVAEGLMQYLTKDEFSLLLRDIVRQVPERPGGVRLLELLRRTLRQVPTRDQGDRRDDRWLGDRRPSRAGDMGAGPHARCVAGIPGPSRSRPGIRTGPGARRADAAGAGAPRRGPHPPLPVLSARRPAGRTCAVGAV